MIEQNMMKGGLRLAHVLKKIYGKERNETTEEEKNELWEQTNKIEDKFL